MRLCPQRRRVFKNYVDSTTSLVTPRSTISYLEKNKCDGNPVAGAQATQELKDKFGLDHALTHESLYKIKHVQLNGQKLYLLGQKRGTTFMYDNVSFDPQPLIGIEFDSDKGGWQFMKGLSVLGLIGSIAYGFFGPKSSKL